jgi:hypothetical protein
MSLWSSFQRGCYSPSDDVDVFFCFEMVLTVPNIQMTPYSEYQEFLHDKIKELHDNKMGYHRIAQWLRENGYKTVRGKRFFANHVYSILKRKRERDANQEQEVQIEYRDFYLEFIERKLINSD